nr:glutamate receptor ionotropic, NMDA 3A-like [Halyomorpha halys]
MNGHAQMAFTALSITRPRSEVIDFSAPYYFSGVSFLAAPSQRTDIPLLAFLLPFSPELWVAIFTSLNVTAVAVAIYEWLSPFGLNPWGRQRTKNFSMSSALWVCWGLLCGHLVAFKAPKSWPNKFLINVWGGFSVIFVASYTANIAALIAGLFFHSATATPNDNSLLSQRVAAPQGSATDYYVQRANRMLWEHMRRIKVPDISVGVQMLKNGTLDILIADSPILDYYRATDQGCKLQKIGDQINDDMYGIGMIKGFPLKDSISSVISKFTSNGYMDLLQEKWYGGLACYTVDNDMSQPKPLGVSAVAGVFLLLGLGLVMGFVILMVEHLFYKYTLPILRHKPKGTIWRSRNIMFFSQKLYRFINCVELVSPHHAARELVHTIRQGQITSLFQKSVKRKEHEQRRRRKSKAQFFEMIQEIRRVQQEEKQNSLTTDCSTGSRQSPRSRKCRSPQLLSPPEHGRRISRLPSKLELARRFSKDVFRSKSSGNLSLRRMSSDINFAASRFLECHSSQAIGRRLSRDTNPSPPDINSRRQSHLLTPELSVASAAELEVAAPRSPYLVPPEIAVHPPPQVTTGHRFSYIDTGNPAFRERLARFTGEHCQSEEMEERRRNAPSLLEQITNMQDQFPNKPKVVSVLPKNKSASEMALRPDASPLERLSREELVGLSQCPGTELKKRVLDALKDKDPT